MRGIVIAGVVATWIAAARAGALGGDAGATIERGRVIYTAQRCAACHSIAGVGSRRYPLDGVGTRLQPEAIRKWIVAPQEMNAKVRKPVVVLPPEDLDALVTYLQSLKQP